MFRFASSQYASVKFRSLSGHRLAGSKLGSLPQETQGFPSTVSQLASAEINEAPVPEDQCAPQEALSRVKPEPVRLGAESGQLTRSLLDRLRTRLFGNHKVVPLPVLTEPQTSDSLTQVVQHEPVTQDLGPENITTMRWTSSFCSSQERQTPGCPGGGGQEREQDARKRPRKRRHKSSSSDEVSVQGSVAPPRDDEEMGGSRVDPMVEGIDGQEENTLGRQSVSSLSLPLNPTNPSFDSTKASHWTPPVPASAQTAPDCVGLLPRIDRHDLDLVFKQSGSSYSLVTLGKGDNGQVVLMQRRSDSSLVAVKRLTHTENPSAADVEFTRETCAMNAVSSSTAFPKLLGVVDRHSFAMEFIGTLDKKTSWSVVETFHRAKMLKSRDWLKVCIDVTKGLMDMHAAGWTHNDLHNANVMVLRDSTDQSGRWEGKIIDLGCASRIKDPPPVKQLTKQQQKHCLRYCGQLAPEIVEGKAQYNPLSDVFSLGVLFTDIAPASKHLSHLKALGKRCSHPEPKMRPATGEVLQELKVMLNNHKNTAPKSRLGSFYQTIKHRIRH